MKNRRNWTAWCLLAALPLLSVQCNKEIVASQWTQVPIKIDGETSDWEDALLYSEKLDASFGVKNDGDNLYLALISANPAQQRQLMRSELVLWLDQDGGRVRDIGFKFPIGLMERQSRAVELFAALHPQEGDIDEARVNYHLGRYFRDLQILDPKNNNLGILAPNEAKELGIQFALKYSKGKMIYELCLPLEGGGRQPWSLTASPKIALGLETPEFDFSPMRGMRPGGMGMMDASGGGGGRGSAGRNMNGGLAGGGMRGGKFSPKPLKMWMTVSPATN